LDFVFLQNMIERVANRLRRWNAVHYPRRMFMPPKWLVLGVNNSCNLHCKMCDVGVNYTQSNFYENLMGSKPVHMPMELFQKIADQAATYFPGVRLGYAFTEPLIYTHLEESLRYAQSKKLRTSLTTNGLGLKKWASVLTTAGLSELNLSLDGPRDLHNYIRGNVHSFSKAMEGVEALVSMNSAIRINVFCVITEWNVGRLVEFLDTMNAFPFAMVGLMHYNFTPQHIADRHNEVFGTLYSATASNTTDAKPEALDVSSLWNEIREIKSRRWNFPVKFSPELPTQEALVRYYAAPDLFMGKRCLDVFSNIMIKSNGDVIPAHGRCYNVTVGNLYQENLQAIWNSSTLTRLRTTLTREGGLLPACSRCCSSFIR
jgi:MoaA/NifB/PqqE/SkfB family radical SAM enzyme